MNAFVSICIFLIVLFLYIHTVAQLKRSEDLEIYEMDYLNNKNLQEICDMKQPVLFDYKTIFPDFFENVTFENVSKQGSFDVKIKETEDYWKNENSVDFVVLPSQSSQTLMRSDTNSRYFSENNQDYIDESGFSKYYSENNSYLKPDYTFITKYDLITGSGNCTTPMRYHTNYRHFLCVNSGKITVKMTPWKSVKYLDIVKDYDNYEFFSRINVWNPQKEYLNAMEKMKFLEFDVNPGFILYVPPFWHYSIKFSDSTENLVCGFTYNSIMNCFANVPNYGLYYLQQSNIKKKVAKTMNIGEKSIPIEESSPPSQNNDASVSI
jgi:hypothetical protein